MYICIWWVKYNALIVLQILDSNLWSMYVGQFHTDGFLCWIFLHSGFYFQDLQYESPIIQPPALNCSGIYWREEEYLPLLGLFHSITTRSSIHANRKKWKAVVFDHEIEPCARGTIKVLGLSYLKVQTRLFP